jgi:cobalt-zinc-cadmium efflux system outer membrane protein
MTKWHPSRASRVARGFAPLLAPLLAPILAIALCHSGSAFASDAVGAPVPARVVTLKEIETITLATNHDIRIARSAVDGALAGIAQADTRPNPTLSWNAASLSPSGGVGGGGLLSKRVDQIVRLDQTIERGGKRELRKTLATRQLEGKQLDLQDQRRATLQAARNAYIDLLLAEQRIDVFDETMRNYAASLDAATKRVKAGDLATADLARFRVEVLRARTDGDAAFGDRAHAQAALALLLASDVDPATLRTDGVWPSDSDFAIDRRPGDEVAGRPDVASAERAVQAASTAIDLARSQRVRDITVGAQFERYPGFGGTGNTVGAGVSIPLMLGNDYRGDIAHAAADFDAAEELAAKTRAAAALEIAGARSDLAVAAAKLATYQGGLLEAAESAAHSADFAFGRGALGIMDLMDARRTLLATRLEALNARADYAKALAAVAAATTQVARGTGR